MSSACVPTAMMWLRIRVISANMAAIIANIVKQVQIVGFVLVYKANLSLLFYTSNVLGSLGNLDVQQLLQRQRVHLLVAHHAHVVQAVHVRQCLHVSLVLAELLGASVQQTNMRIGSSHNLEWMNEYSMSFSCVVFYRALVWFTSPSSSMIKRSTPCAAGCCGPKLRITFWPSALFCSVSALMRWWRCKHVLWIAYNKSCHTYIGAAFVSIWRSFRQCIELSSRSPFWSRLARHRSLLPICRFISYQDKYIELMCYIHFKTKIKPATYLRCSNCLAAANGLSTLLTPLPLLLIKPRMACLLNLASWIALDMFDDLSSKKEVNNSKLE